MRISQDLIEQVALDADVSRSVAARVLRAVSHLIPEVQIDHRLNQPTTCKVWILGRLEFDGQDRTEQLR